jgi:hypothetical protein
VVAAAAEEVAVGKGAHRCWGCPMMVASGMGLEIEWSRVSWFAGREKE